ncbi:MAG TPA: tripartite tricarboxylate transporter substrate-binding protein [Alphaproteobacteria bacterium]|nr:tripartite tricarboxylate transporter substrate-binding protein [Alphaproteobacteria bacterium]
MKIAKSLPIAGAMLAAGFLIGAPVQAQSLKGQTVNIFAGGEVGGYDLYGRLLGQFMGKHLAGSPTFVVKNMPGAGTLRAANYIWEVAPKDGTALGTVGGGTATAEMFGSQGVRFDPRKYVWVGSMNSEVGLVVAWHTQPIKTIQQVYQQEFVVGGGGPTSGNVVFPNVMNRVLGTKFKIIGGYKSTGDIALAIERGELQGTASYHYSSIITRNPAWLENKQVNVLLQGSLRRHEKFPDVPTVADLAKTEEQKQLIDLVFARQEMGRPFMLPPGTPAAIGEEYRKAFDALMKDPEMLAQAEKQKMDLNNPMSGKDIHALIDRLYTVPKDVIAKAAEATGEAGQ